MEQRSGFFCLSRAQDFLEFFVLYETEMPHFNVMKDVQREGIKLCEKNCLQDLLVGRVETSSEGFFGA